MSDYFDELETDLRDAVRRRAHLPWYGRIAYMSLRRRSALAVIAALVVATPTVAAVGAVSGWFGKGASDLYHPASATSGLGKVLPKDGRLLPIRVADPAGGPPWGIRLVKTTRGETCIQVGRVVNGQIGALGIDGSWNDDHRFHEIKPNDQLADLCGATDGAGNGFVNEGAYNAPASVDVPIYNGRHIPAPASSLRMIFVGLLGPEAKSVTYKAPDGQIGTEQTSGGVGAYLVVFRETPTNCLDYAKTLLWSLGGICGNTGLAPSVALQLPSAMRAVTYDDGKTCSDEPSRSIAAAYQRFVKHNRGSSAERWSRLQRQFLAAHHLAANGLVQVLVPKCGPVGWVAPKLPKLTAPEIASPIRVRVVRGERYCHRGSGYPSAVIACDNTVPAGYTPFDPGGNGPQLLVTVSFVARQAVTNANSWYQWELRSPARVSSGSSTQGNLRRGRRIRFTDFIDADEHGVYSGTITFIQDAGKNGAQPAVFYPPGTGVVVGHFRFKLPLKK